MKHCYKIFFLTVLCALHFFAAVAQIIPSKKYIIDEESGAARINVLFKKSNGYILAGTKLGLYKFDGIKFSRINFKNPDFTDNVTAIHEDVKGKMWIGFESGRIANIFNNQLVYWNPEEGTPKQKITSITSDKSGIIYFATNGEGIYVFRNNHLYLISKEEGLTEQSINAIELCDENNLLAATDQGLAAIQMLNGKTSVRMILPKDGLPDYIITSICKINQNECWLGLQDKGICLYNRSTQKITTPDSAWQFGPVTSIESSQQKLWIGTEDNGMVVMDSATMKINEGDINIVKQVTSIIADDFGNIFLSSKDNSCTKIHGLGIKLYPLPSSVLFDHVHSVLKDMNGNFWLTDFNNHLLIFDATITKQLRKITLPGVNEKTDITSLYQDQKGNVWVGIVGNNLFAINPKDYSYKIFPNEKEFEKRTILSINGRGNKIFVSSLEGPFSVTIKDDGNFSYNEYNIKNAGTNYVYSIFEDSNGDTWFATDGNGIIRLHDGVYSVYGKDVLTDDRIYSIAEDHHKNIWFSSARHGIYKYNGTFKNYGLAEGLTDLNISTVKCDNNGNIIIIHKKGIDVLNPENETFNHLNSSAGISKINIEDLDASTTDAKGNLYFSTANGIVEYTSASATLPQPRTILESVQLFMNELPDDHSHTFSYDDNNFTFNYSGLYYSDPEQVLYQYKLEGYDTSWITTTDRSKTFPKLSPGKYTFRIRSSLNKNFLQANEATYSFKIKQAFYKTWWFLILCAALLISGIIFIVRYRERSLRNMEKLQREKIQFQFEVLRTQVNPHFLFNSFNTLMAIIDEDPKVAIEYVEQLSDFFRDILKYRDKEIISLQEELTLLQNYFYLQQKRFGNNIQLNINASLKDRSSCFIPPLTLQLLLENAIKHNVISKTLPLQFTIDVEDGNLLVMNNVTTKKENAKGEGMGLQNIVNRYKLLSNKNVTIRNTKNIFKVTLPFIEHA